MRTVPAGAAQLGRAGLIFTSLLISSQTLAHDLSSEDSCTLKSSLVGVSGMPCNCKTSHGYSENESLLLLLLVKFPLPRIRAALGA